MIFTWVDYTPSKYADYPYPVWADALGWLITMTSVMAIPVVMGINIVTKRQTGESLIQVNIKI